MPEPVLVAIAAALAGKGVGSLYDMVKKKFTGRTEAIATLEAAADAAPESAEVQALSEELATAVRSDPRFGNELRSLWQSVTAETGGIVNQSTGTISGKVVQARDVAGGVSIS
jgi:hypothetical protein